MTTTPAIIDRADIVVVGAGILGLAVAWALGKALGSGGGRSVLVVDRHPPATQATARAAALLTRARGDAATAALVRGTYAAIAGLEAELDGDLGLRRVGTLHVAASPARVDALRALVAASPDPVDWLDGAGAARIAPCLSAEAVERAAFMPLDGFIDPVRLADAYRRSARRSGVRIRDGVAVRAIRVEHGRVAGIDTGDGLIAAPLVVNAAGAWAAGLAWSAGIGLPQAPVRSQYWITQVRRDLFPPDLPALVMPDAGAYARPELGALLFGLRGRRSLAFDPARLPDDTAGLDLGDSDGGWQTLEEGWQALARLCPALLQVGIAHYVSGLSTYTADGRFVLGPVPEPEGLFMATGCCGAGIAASGGIGRAVAASILGAAGGADLSPFAPGRLGAVDPFSPALRDACAAARSGKTAG
ncbi:FAD-dependent oxidoreductase (plasmid) [Azospirillum sp. B510]|uniref:NAD(P)/FAD-dependent oxidoreductase n=1 Tax=Azospirillum sp. (strain B510) TaxID=137722 RepID=UPI0001C4B7F9|nr:FAD-binding oxidoreductase [Azospirillum sp. B510]BAI74578.1 FAD-dependent oxidoreductase [Azospirillum sp. B510]